jgi:DNA-binding LacI/PurR family transcriptional regulator
MGELAAQQLLQHISTGEPLPEEIRVEAELVVRESTFAARTA